MRELKISKMISYSKMGIIDLLVTYEHISTYVKTYWEYVKEQTRLYLGPSPNTTYLIFDNDEVIPQGKEHCKYAHVSQFNPQEGKVVNDSSAPFKRLPWISVQHIIGDHTIDISDWMSEIRSNTTISLLALIRLASHVLNKHLPETSHAKIQVISRNGEEEEYKYSGKASLLQRIAPTPVGDAELHRRQTCPYDVPDGLFF